MHLYLSNRDSSGLFPQNTTSNFTVQLPQHIDLTDGVWTCAVTHCILPSRPTEPVYVTADFVESSGIVGGRFQPVLCMTTAKTKEFQHITRVGIKRSQLSTLHLKIVNRQHQDVTLRGTDTLIILELQND